MFCHENSWPLFLPVISPIVDRIINERDKEEEKKKNITEAASPSNHGARAAERSDGRPRSDIPYATTLGALQRRTARPYARPPARLHEINRRSRGPPGWSKGTPPFLLQRYAPWSASSEDSVTFAAGNNARNERMREEGTPGVKACTPAPEEKAKARDKIRANKSSHPYVLRSPARPPAHPLRSKVYCFGFP